MRAARPRSPTSSCVHDRPIQTRVDDSVVRALDRLARRAAADPALARLRARARSRSPIRCARPVLACGAELKSTFCLAKGERAWVGHHIGDLEDLRDARLVPRRGRAPRASCSRSQPELVAHDLHPDYLSTRYALEREGVEPVGVQHHHAHLAACLAEHGERRRGGRRDLRRRRARPRRHRLGRGAPRRRLRRLRARRAPAPGAPAGRRRGRPRALADGVRLARRRARARGPAVRAERSPARSSASAGRRSAGWSRRLSPRR